MLIDIIAYILITFLILFSFVISWLFLCFLQENMSQTKIRTCLFVFSKAMLVVSFVLSILFFIFCIKHQYDYKHYRGNNIKYEIRRVDNRHVFGTVGGKTIKTEIRNDLIGKNKNKTRVNKKTNKTNQKKTNKKTNVKK